jgi:hypothetical protein
MADFTADEKRAAQEELKNLRMDVEALKHQGEALKKVSDKMEPHVGYLKVLWGAVAAFAVVLITALFSAVWQFSAMTRDLEHQGRIIAELKKTAEKRHDADIAFREDVRARLPRQGVGAVSHEGKLLRAGQGEVVIRTADGKELSFRFTSPNVTLKGKPADLFDLRPGMLVRVTEGKKGVVTAIDAEPIKEP